MRTWTTVVAALALASGGAAAGAEPAALLLSEQFEVGGPPAPREKSHERERSQAVNGALYAVIAPLYVAPPFLSYIRLVNAGDTTAAFTITVVGSGSATAYGTATYLVPTAATMQLSMAQILTAAGAVARNDVDGQFSFYIQSAAPLAGYQHVTLNEAARYFDNASVCRYTLQEAQREATSQVMLPSIHTSRLAAAGYPAQIELHNFANAPITYRFYVRDEATGALLNPGGMDFPTRPNASYVIPWSYIENRIGFSPSESQIRANLVVVDPAGAPPQILLSQTILNTAASASVNMTSTCAVNKPPAGGDFGGLPVGGGGIRY